MKRLIFIFALIALLAACTKTDDEKAQPLMRKIEGLYANGDYRAALDSITRLRSNFPKAVESRKKALKLWQEASLKMAQADIAHTDSALQATIAQYNAATTIRERNYIGIKKDSLQTRYDALCLTVRAIHKRQKE